MAPKNEAAPDLVFDSFLRVEDSVDILGVLRVGVFYMFKKKLRKILLELRKAGLKTMWLSNNS